MSSDDRLEEIARKHPYVAIDRPGPFFDTEAHSLPLHRLVAILSHCYTHEGRRIWLTHYGTGEDAIAKAEQLMEGQIAT